MPRTSDVLTQNEINSFQAFAKENNLVLDGDAGVKNGEEIANYICSTWNEDINSRTLAVALDKLQDRLTFLTPSQIEYQAVAAAPDAQSALENWYETQTLLVKDDAGKRLHNLTQLSIELRGRDITRDSILRAIDYNRQGPTKANPTRKALYFVPASRLINGKQHAVDPNQKTGELFDRSQVNKSPAQYKAEMEAALSPKAPVVTREKALDSSEAAWKSFAERKRDSWTNHAQREELQEAFNKAIAENKGWCFVDGVLDKIVRRYQRAKVVR